MCHLFRHNMWQNPCVARQYLFSGHFQLCFSRNNWNQNTKRLPLKRGNKRIKETKENRTCNGTNNINLKMFLPKFLMTSSSLAGCLEPGTPPSHSALRSTSHQLASGTGIGVYSGPYPKSQGYYNTSDATALYSRVSFTFHLQFSFIGLLSFCHYLKST